MPTIKSLNNESLMDVAIRYYGNAEKYAQLLADNILLTPDSVLASGDNLIVDDTKVNPTIIDLITPQIVEEIITKPKVTNNQNIIDLAIQYYGSADGLANLLVDNPDFSIDISPVPGSEIKVSTESDSESLQIIKARNYTIATGSEPPVERDALVLGTEDDKGIATEDNKGIEA